MINEEDISTEPCARCGNPSQQQWQICADNNQWRGICDECDVGLNTLVMRYVFGDTREDDIVKYREKMLGV